jgi:predicted DNA-binding transcriptional regulator AlpA
VQNEDQQSQAITKTAARVPDALRDFDSLPDSAHVRLPVVQMLFACSSNTVWRRVKSGALPAPKKFSQRITAWNVGALRAAQRSTGAG